MYAVRHGSTYHLSRASRRTFLRYQTRGERDDPRLFVEPLPPTLLAKLKGDPNLRQHLDLGGHFTKAETRARDLAGKLVEVQREDADRLAKVLAAGRKPPPARAAVSAALFGSVHHAVVNGADRPVLVVRKPKE